MLYLCYVEVTEKNNQVLHPSKATTKAVLCSVRAACLPFFSVPIILASMPQLALKQEKRAFAKELANLRVSVISNAMFKTHGYNNSDGCALANPGYTRSQSCKRQFSFILSGSIVPGSGGRFNSVTRERTEAQ